VPEEPYVWEPADRPDAEVLVDGTWWPAELRMRSQRADGYWYNAAWHREGDTRLDDFHQEDVRPDTADRSVGRG
jgi:hypothetical protein